LWPCACGSCDRSPSWPVSAFSQACWSLGSRFPRSPGSASCPTTRGDTVTAGSTDVLDGPLPLTSIVTDSKSTPIARFFEPNQNRQAVTSDKIAPA
jgi:hypothetical protein